MRGATGARVCIGTGGVIFALYSDKIGATSIIFSVGLRTGWITGIVMVSANKIRTQWTAMLPR
jgi:Na+-transporting NADH:ubiquinone oxidoreductase subunit NqrE